MSQCVLFGEFKADVASGELFRNGEKVRVQDLPFRVLVELLTRAGDVVTRDELRAKLWGAETFVDAEAGLNTAIAKLREALGDRAESPRFIETVPKRGYRFIGAPPTTGALSASAPPARPVPASRWKYSAIAGVLLVIVVAAAFAMQRRLHPPHKPTIAVVLFHNETGQPDNDRLAQQLTDATTVALAGEPDVSVIGNAAILRTPRIFADIKVIADALGADYVLVAQVQTPPEGLTVRLHFIQATDQTHLWAKNVTAGPAGLERAVVEAVVSGVRRSLNHVTH